LSCSLTGDRLTGHSAMLCYICAGDLEKLVECWMSNRDTESGPKALQDLVEVVMSLKASVERQYGQEISIGGVGGEQQGRLSRKLTEYANLLAAQGALSAALSYLGGGGSGDESIEDLRSRLDGAIGVTQRQRTASYQQQQQAKIRTTSGEL
jgi:protein transport protein SEC31